MSNGNFSVSDFNAGTAAALFNRGVSVPTGPVSEPMWPQGLSLMDGLARQHFEPIPLAFLEAIPLPPLSGRQLKETGELQREITRMGCRPVHGLHDVTDQRLCRGLNDVYGMQLRAKGYVENRYSALPRTGLASNEWLPDWLRNRLDDRPIRLAAEVPATLLDFAGEVKISALDDDAFQQKGLSHRKRWCARTGLSASEYPGMQSKIIWDSKAKHLMFHVNSFSERGLKPESAAHWVRAFKGSALRAERLPSMLWAQSLHSPLVHALETIVVRELLGKGELPAVARRLQKSLGTEACMTAYLSPDPEDLRKPYIHLALEWANAQIRLTIESLMCGNFQRIEAAEHFKKRDATDPVFPESLLIKDVLEVSSVKVMVWEEFNKEAQAVLGSAALQPG